MIFEPQVLQNMRSGALPESVSVSRYLLSLSWPERKVSCYWARVRFTVGTEGVLKGYLLFEKQVSLEG